MVTTSYTTPPRKIRKLVCPKAPKISNIERKLSLLEEKIEDILKEISEIIKLQNEIRKHLDSDLDSDSSSDFEL